MQCRSSKLREAFRDGSVVIIAALAHRWFKIVTCQDLLLYKARSLCFPTGIKENASVLTSVLGVFETGTKVVFFCLIFLALEKART